MNIPLTDDEANMLIALLMRPHFRTSETDKTAEKIKNAMSKKLTLEERVERLERNQEYDREVERAWRGE